MPLQQTLTLAEQNIHNGVLTCMSENERLWKVVEQMHEFKSELELSIKGDEKININKDITIKLINKLTSLFEKSQFEDGDLVRNISSLRYAFEALVQTRLLLKEPKYPYQLYLAIHKVQEKQIENAISRLEKEISLYEDLEKEDSAKGIELGMKFAEQYSLSNDADVKSFGNELYKQMEQIDNSLKSHITVWSENIETNGYGFHASILKNKILPQYQKEKEELNKLSVKREKEMANDGYFNLFFETNGQSTKVFKVVNDNRSWSQKASDAGLQDEYNFIYSYTSALIHCTSYSFMTANNLSDDETDMIYKLAEQYINKILDCLKELTTGVEALILDPSTKQWKNISEEIKKSANRRST